MAGPTYMLDTNVVSDIVRLPGCPAARLPGCPAARRAAAVEPGGVAISTIVAAELRYGAERRGSARLARQLEAVLSAIDTLPLEPPADGHYATIRNELERKGSPIGHNDLLIAAHARALGVVLVTNNVGEFRRVPGLSIEDWR